MENEEKITNVIFPIGCPVVVFEDIKYEGVVVVGYSNNRYGELCYLLNLNTADSLKSSSWHYTRVQADPRDIVKWRLKNSQ